MNKVISTQDGSGSEVEEYKKSLMESLITDIISKDGDISQAEELERFQNQLSSPNISLSQKINNIMGYQVTLIAPMLMMISDKDLTDKDLRRVRGAEKLFYILDKIQNYVYRKTEYEMAEEIDFTHPKIQKAFEFMVEAMLETMNEVGIDEIAMENFVTTFGLKMQGFEQDLNTRMRGVASSISQLSKVTNPLMEKYRETKN